MKKKYNDLIIYFEKKFSWNVKNRLLINNLTYQELNNLKEKKDANFPLLKKNIANLNSFRSSFKNISDDINYIKNKLNMKKD